jgi:hypothetical protein
VSGDLTLPSKWGCDTFHEYIDVFMKTFLHDFIGFNDLSTHLEKLKKCFLKCKNHVISLNPKKCAFMVCFKIILRFIVSKDGKTLDLRKIKALVKMLVPKNLRRFKFSMEWHSFIDVS